VNDPLTYHGITFISRAMELTNARGKILEHPSENDPQARGETINFDPDSRFMPS
jgi:hypothetical protein